jgi:nucleoside-diphosphate-sugar epimerase
MRILITGVSGFIGQALTKALSGHELFGLYERPHTMAKNPEIPTDRKFMCDLRDATQVEYVVDRVQPDIVLHLAARSEVANSFDNYREVSDINYLGTVTLAEACRKFTNLALFVMASTMETYGHQDPANGPFTEDTPQNPMAPYAVAKLASERYLAYMRYAYDFPFTALRQTNSYGRHDNDFFVVERIVTQMLRGDVCNLGDPDPVRNFLYIDDLVTLYVALIDQPLKAVGETFVTGPDNAITIRDLAAKVSGMLGWAGQVNWHTIPRRVGEIYYLNSDPAKARDVLEWKPEVDLTEGLEQTIEKWRGR